MLDLVTMLFSFGPSDVGGPCDVDGDGIVGIFDLIDLLAVFGQACP